jgi:hypothetical protein
MYKYLLQDNESDGQSVSARNSKREFYRHTVGKRTVNVRKLYFTGFDEAVDKIYVPKMSVK